MCNRLFDSQLLILGSEFILTLSQQNCFQEMWVLIPFSGNIAGRYRDLASEIQLKIWNISHCCTWSPWATSRKRKNSGVLKPQHCWNYFGWQENSNPPHPSQAKTKPCHVSEQRDPVQNWGREEKTVRHHFAGKVSQPRISTIRQRVRTSLQRELNFEVVLKKK